MPKYVTRIGLSTLALLLAHMTGCMIPKIDVDRLAADQSAGAEHLVGVNAGGSIAWVISTENGVVLVDAGWDDKAEAVREEIGDREVHAILLTHGHFDHTGALSHFPDAPVIVGPGEMPLVLGERVKQGWMAGMAAWMMGGDAYEPVHLRQFEDGEILEIDGIQIRAIHTPGHTLGSAMYIHNDVLFIGDTVVGNSNKKRVQPLPGGTYTERREIYASMERALDFDFEFIADGHVGLHEGARPWVQNFVDGRPHTARSASQDALDAEMEATNDASDAAGLHP